MTRRSLAVLAAMLGMAMALPRVEIPGPGDSFTGSPPEDCECVPYYQCANGTIIKNGVGLIDIRLRDGPCDSYLDVCCRPPDRIEVPNRGDATGGTGGSAGDEGTGGHGTGGHGTDHGTGGQGGDYGTGGDHGGGDFGAGGDGGGHGTGGQGGDHGTGGDHGGDFGGGHGTGGQGGGHGTGDHGGGHGDHSIGCGLRNKEGVGFRIIGDTDGESQFGEFPWMTAILHEESVGDGTEEKLNVYKCGGSLIHPQVVLTAAHCVHETRTGLKVRVGEWDTQTRSELLPHQDRNVRQVITHPDFHHDSLYNDFALLVLDAPVELAENVQTVCLPEHGAVADHGRCAASGWGKDVFGKEGRYQVILKKVEVPPVARAECLERLRETRLGKYFQLHESFMCAGGEAGEDTCKGDGGGPLVCPMPGDSKHYQQMGIVAWGIGCGERNPAVYADVAYARQWVDNQMGELGYGTSSYTRQ